MRQRGHRAITQAGRRLHPRPRDVQKDDFVAEFGADVVLLPATTCLLGCSNRRQWLVHGFVDGGGHGRERLDPLIRFLDRHVRPALDVESFWFFFNHWDAWREMVPYSTAYRWVLAEEWELGPGEIPILSRDRRWVACFGAHHDDPSALLLPEAHYLSRLFYRPLFARMRTERVPWKAKRPAAIFAGGDHGPKAPGGTRRRRLRAVVEAERLPVDVFLGRGVSRRSQIRHKYLLDVDGWARTWDAWAWKLASGSTVLSPSSDFTTFFTELFEPWEHFVPLAADFSDLSEKLEWCGQHDPECQEIARRARARVDEVYRPEWVGTRLTDALSERLTAGLARGGAAVRPPPRETRAPPPR